MGLEVFDFGWVDCGVKAGEVLKAGNFRLEFLLHGNVGILDHGLGDIVEVALG